MVRHREEGEERATVPKTVTLLHTRVRKYGIWSTFFGFVCMLSSTAPKKWKKYTVTSHYKCSHILVCTPPPQKKKGQKGRSQICKWVGRFTMAPTILVL